MNHSSCRETVATLKPCNAKHGTWSIQALVAVSSLLTSVSSQGHAATAFRGAGGSPLPRTRRALPLGPREPRSQAQDRAPETVLDFFFFPSPLLPLTCLGKNNKQVIQEGETLPADTVYKLQVEQFLLKSQVRVFTQTTMGEVNESRFMKTI